MNNTESPEGKSWFSTNHPIKSAGCNTQSEGPDTTINPEEAEERLKKEQRELLSKMGINMKGYVRFD